MANEIKFNSSKEIEEILNNANLSLENLKYLAKEVANNSWSPISQFPVGAVIVGIDQSKIPKVFAGTNVEPTVHLTVCAERVALYSGIAAGYKRFIAAAISLPKATEFIKSINHEPDICNFTPCGACREVLYQKLDPKALIVNDVIDRSFTPKELLPKPLLDINKLKTLTIEEMNALEKARMALHNAHVPYNKEKYGVSILIENTSEIFSATSLDSHSTGCSVEPLKSTFGMYAASGNLKSNNKIKSIVFAYPFVKYPTGDVLQIISDYCSPETKIIIDNMGVATIDELLPWAFKLPG